MSPVSFVHHVPGQYHTIEVSTVPFPVTLGSTSVMFDNLPAPMVAVSPGQLVVVVPQGVAGPTTDVVVRRGSETGPAQSAPVSPIRPGLFSQAANGSGPGAIQNIVAGGVQLNTFQTPAKPNQAVTIFGTAFGPTQTPVPDGFASSGANRILARARIMIGPQMVEPLFVGLSPDSPHLYQANAVVPSNAQTGCSVPVKAIIDGVESNRDYILHARCASLMAWRSGATSKPAHSRVLEDSSARLPFWRDCSHSSSRWLGW